MPKTWIDRYPHIFRTEDAQAKDTHSLTPAHPTAFCSIVLQPITAGTTKEDGANLVEWLSSSKTIVHAGTTLSVWSIDSVTEGSSPKFKVKMMEPATSGFVEKAITRVVLVHPNSRQEPQVNGIHNDSIAESSSDEDADSLYDIDERFLSNMVDSRVNDGMQVCPFLAVHDTVRLSL